MTEPVASALFNVIFDKLTDEALKKYARSKKIHSELNELQSTLSQIRALLIDASDKEVTHKYIGLWLNSLQHMAYDIDDILDDVATKAMHHELTQESKAFTSKVKKLIVPTCFTDFSLTQSLRDKLDDITTKLQSLEKQTGNLGLIQRNDNQNNNYNNRGDEFSFLDSYVVGREGEKEKLLNELFGGESSKKKLNILPIVGMGGVGKTTLAKMVYNDSKVMDSFSPMVWVCVSGGFDIFKIYKTIYVAASGQDKNFEDLNQLQTTLTELFRERKFLLVVDDVCSEKYDDWEILTRPFRLCAPGSRIIITTRKEELLKKLGFDHLDHLECLSEKDSLSLLALHALDVETFDSHPTLKANGEGIVRKCGGLPLALKAIGRLLQSKTDKKDWDDMLNSELWYLKICNEVVPILRLSYHDLSANLKQLFAYCSFFPKGFLFDKEELVLLWMAEGYLNETSTNKSPECLGHECFESLLSRSFFQYAPNNKSLFVMHNLMNDLAIFVSKEFSLRFDKHTNTTDEALAKYRHLSFIQEEYVGQKFEAFNKAKSLRTFFGVYIGVEESWKDFYLSNMILVNVLPNLPLLRVLSLKSCNIRDVSEFIGNLKHLRYLNLSQTDIEELPEDVGSLYNLQTLIVFGCSKLRKLPKSFVKLKKLRHLDMRDTPHLKKFPLGIGELRNLQTLTKIVVGGGRGFAISELKGLKDLHGKISIEGLHKVQNSMHAREANLILKELNGLELKWDDGSQSGTLEKEVLTELKPHTNTLISFGIQFYAGIKFPSWVGDSSFHKLVRMSIRGCKNCTSLPPLGQLPSLKNLFIEDLGEVRFIGVELIGSADVAFPSLETLVFSNMSGLEEWSTNSSKVVFPRLRELNIKNCPKLVQVSLEALPSLRDLVIESCSDGVLTSVVQVASSITHLKVESVIGLTDEVWRGVIKYLWEVEEVTIWECNEIRYLWESEWEASKVLVNLKKLEVWWCDNLMSLGEEEDDESNLLPSLKILDILCCNTMERVCCPNGNNIEVLRVVHCESITCVSFPTTTGEAGGGGQKVKSLEISGCKKLTENINNSNMAMVEKVSIYDLTSLKSMTQLSTTFIHLTSLSIRDCSSIESLSEIQLLNLTDLEIINCERLELLPELSNLALLKDLTIKKCPSMSSSFPCGVIWPPKLVRLEIGGLQKPILEWDRQNFPTSLVELKLWGEDGVSDFSQLSHLLPSSLTLLHIEEFGTLESLSIGLQHLTSLQHLFIWKCPNIKHLPKTLLPSLLRLEIISCQKLKKRCNGKGSYYWPQISHIPCIHI